MLRQFLACLLLVAFVSGQTAPPTPPAPAAPKGAPTSPAAPGKAPESPAPEVKVGPDDPVVTIKGYCTDAKLEGDACKTVITRAQFDKLVDTLQPGMSPSMRRQLAINYARMLAMSAAAEKRSLDKTPRFEESMHLARMQNLSRELGNALQTEAGNVSDQDIQDHYTKNAANFEQANFVRIFVPHTKRIQTPPAPKKQTPKADSSAGSKTAAPAPKKSAPESGSAAGASKTAPTKPKKIAFQVGSSADTSKAATPAPKKAAPKADSSAASPKTATTTPKTTAKKLSPEEQQKAGEEAMKKEADLLRARLVKGEDPDKLEKEAYAAGGLMGTPTPTKMEKMRRTSLPAGHQSAMDLKSGEVSQVISDPSGNYIYKLISKETLPLDSVKKEIQSQISAQRFREAMQHFQNNADLNDAYFGAGRGPGPGMMPPRGPRKPGKPEDEDRD